MVLIARRNQIQTWWECKHFGMRLAFAVGVCAVMFGLILLTIYCTKFIEDDKKTNGLGFFAVALWMLIGGATLTTLG